MAIRTESALVSLEQEAQELRIRTLTMLAHAGSGHTAGPLGMADIFAALYFEVLRHRPHEPLWEERDRLILSNGHIVPIRYAAMARSGYFPEEELMTLRRFGSRLQGHPERLVLPGVETTSGPLGEGLGQAAGIALGARMDSKDLYTYVVLSDGEHDCGGTWEAALFAAHQKLDHLIAIVDRNGIQLSGTTESTLSLDSLSAKYEAFNWRTILIDGHNMEMICDAFDEARMSTGRPTVIIAETVPGKGVPEIEGDYTWHGKVPTAEQAERWIDALRQPQKTSRTTKTPKRT